MKLNPELLFQLGFRGEGRDIVDTPCYRLKLPNSYPYELQMTLGDYPEGNPNSGILSIYSRAEKDVHMYVEDTAEEHPDFVMGEEKGTKYGIKYIDIPELIQPIAWRVTTLERLNAIYTALTENPPLKPFQDIIEKLSTKSE